LDARGSYASARIAKKAIEKMNVSRFLARKDISAFGWATFIASSILGLIAFGPLIVVLFPITFLFGLGVGVLTVAPFIWFLRRRGITAATPYVLGSVGVGIVITFLYGMLSGVAAGSALADFDVTASALLSLPVAIAFAVGGYVFWFKAVKKQ
jgi:hypothetical protein